MATPIEERGYAHPDVLVSTDWVAQHLNDPKVRVIESNEDTLLYASGHVPGAVHVDWTTDLNDQVRRDYITREGFEALMSKIGATNDTTVVFYGDKNNWWACYAFWVFQLFGHTNAKVMDGGRLKWEKEKRDDEPRRPVLSRRRSTRRRSAHDAPHRAFRDDVLAHLKKQGQLVDVRSPEEYAGTRMHMPDYPNEGALRGGHIPGAKSVPWAQGDQPRRRHLQVRGGAEEALLEDKQLSPDEDDDRLLPHRRAQQPHLVRAELPARLQEHPQLRRQLDRVGQHGRRPDREVARSRQKVEGSGRCPRSCRRSSTCSRCSIRRIERTCS